MSHTIRFSATGFINTSHLSATQRQKIQAMAQQHSPLLNQMAGNTQVIAFEPGFNAADQSIKGVLDTFSKTLNKSKSTSLYTFLESPLTHRSQYPKGIVVAGAVPPEFATILTPEALAFVGELARKFGPERERLLANRVERQKKLDTGMKLDFLPETKHIRQGKWKIAPLPEDLQARRVEITGPTDRKMIINALNSGASVFMADLEDSSTPTWENVIHGQINLRDAANKTIEYVDPKKPEPYRLKPKTAVLMVRPRGWHLVDKHILVDGKPVSASMLDFGLYFYHNAKKLMENGTAPYFYLPKMESHEEAKLWNDIFVDAQKKLGIRQGTIKATVLIETITAAFEMDEILNALRKHSAGLNCGRWDYIFSTIKKFKNNPDFVFADRANVTMTSPFMRAYSQLAIQTAHKRNAPAIGGMAAQIPISNDPVANEEAMAKVRADKLREVTDGHDGTWVAHPGLIPIAREIFDQHMTTPNQIQNKRKDLHVTAADLTHFAPSGPITEDGLRKNISIAIQYLGAWISGTGCVPIHNLMEDAATAEISRSQVWQWVHSPKGLLDDGRKVTSQLVQQLTAEELQKVKANPPQIAIQKQIKPEQYEEAARMFESLATGEDFAEFLTLPGYERVVQKSLLPG